MSESRVRNRDTYRESGDEGHRCVAMIEPGAGRGEGALLQRAGNALACRSPSVRNWS